MGLCGSTQLEGMTEEERRQLSADKNINRQIDKGQQKDAQKEKGIRKLLLLGAGESGKSTMFKQMITIYGTGWPLEERRRYTSVIHMNALLCMKALCEASLKIGEPECKDSLQYVMGIQDEESVVIGPENVAHFKRLWADRTVQTAYETRSKFQVPDSAKYYLEQLDLLSAADYVPSEQDIYRSRVATSGIVVRDFNVDGNQFKLIDVGGQRNERKKWMACFEGVTAVIFFGVLSEYDLVLYEDSRQNRMVETLNLFEETCMSPWFEKTAMILFLNKRDSFLEKIAQVPLTHCPLFSEYTGPNTYEAGVELIQETFHARAKNKMTYTHITCATDTSNMKVVLDAVKDLVIRTTLNNFGLLG